jgi:ribosome-associated protein
MPDPRPHQSVKIGDRPINLTQALKLAGCVQSGGEAKLLIGDGRVRVNGEVETRKRRKLSTGDRVDVDGGAIFELET